MNQVAARPSVEFRLKVIEGPDQGTAFKLLSANVKIGRGNDNDIVLKDLTVSRHHATIEFSQMGALIKNLSDRSPVTINGSVLDEAFLNQNDVIQLGSTKLQFEMTGAQAQLPQTPRLSVTPDHQPSFPKAKPLHTAKFAVSSGGKNNRTTFYVIIAVVVLLAAWLFSGSPTPGKRKIELVKDEEVKSTAEAIEKKEAAENQAREQKGVKTQDYQRAQADFLRGRRDYDNGLFSRASDAFNSCLTNFPKHELCRRYLILAGRRLDQTVQNDMRLGIENYNNQKYRECFGIFNRLIYVIGDDESPKYKDAIKYRDICQKYLEGTY